MSHDHLTVVTSARWLADDLRAAGTIGIDQILGLDAPVLDGRTALWCSGAWALRLLKAGVQHPFLSAGPDWLTRVPAEFLRRDVWAGTIGRMPYRGEGKMFYKLAEHKHGDIPAGLYLTEDTFQRHVRNVFATADHVDELHFVGSAPMRYTREYRCFIAHGTVTAASFYLATLPGVNDSTATITWDAYNGEQAPDASRAAAFAQDVVDAMGADQPPGYTLDVGEDADGDWSVIEANAAWSSNIYHAPAAGVIDSVLASQEPGNNRWGWTPDALFFNRTQPLGGVR
ncbi:ATP-grasp domain-containing protein [Paeniglutamicibacter antarcticus]|uniref:ATP-grasp domain-containing protein n=1 Tax=Arthrobacter terrae TaxID=2935737 RepID=A0A931G4T5_9MICC|nr:ATP-grasp domain-containing protein [Arthrobacter terrae]MBG0738760.1 ATP-grasp domain-containing protein [Arthrobacter terrae]